MYQALYRTYRPEVFEEILGQEHIVKILKNQIKTDSVSHAYLFCGTRGTGKTTTARILAKGLNCLADSAAGRVDLLLRIGLKFRLRHARLGNKLFQIFFCFHDIFLRDQAQSLMILQYM